MGVSITVDGPRVPIPGLTWGIPKVSGVNVFLQLGGSIEGTINFNKDYCADDFCNSGTLKGVISLTGGAQAYIGTNVATVGLKGGIAAMLVVKCNGTGTFTFGLSETNAIGELVFFNGTKISVSKPLFAATDLGSVTFGLPQPAAQ